MSYHIYDIKIERIPIGSEDGPEGYKVTLHVSSTCPHIEFMVLDRAELLRKLDEWLWGNQEIKVA